MSARLIIPSSPMSRFYSETSSSGLPRDKQRPSLRDILATRGFEYFAEESQGFGAAFEFRTFECGPLLLDQSIRGPGITKGNPTRASPPNSDIVTVQFLIEGDGLIRHDSGDLVVSRDRPVIIDPSRPWDAKTSGDNLLTYRVPRAALALGRGQDLSHGLLPATLLSALFRDHLIAVSRRSADITADEAEHAGAATAAFFRAVLAQSRDALAEAKSEVDAALVRRAQSLIRANLSSRLLSPELIAGRIGVSRRKLYSLFEPTGGVMHYVQRMRLEAAREALLQPGPPGHLKGVAFDAGFANEAHFSRSFKRLFGHNPSEVREHALKSPIDP